MGINIGRTNTYLPPVAIDVFADEVLTNSGIVVVGPLQSFMNIKVAINAPDTGEFQAWIQDQLRLQQQQHAAPVNNALSITTIGVLAKQQTAAVGDQGSREPADLQQPITQVLVELAVVVVDNANYCNTNHSLGSGYGSIAGVRRNSFVLSGKLIVQKTISLTLPSSPQSSSSTSCPL